MGTGSVRRVTNGLEAVIPRSELAVAVRQYGPIDFRWELVRRGSSRGPSERIALSSEHFPDYDQALNAGFVALQALCS